MRAFQVLVTAGLFAAMCGTALPQDNVLTISDGTTNVVFTPAMAAEMPQQSVTTMHWYDAQNTFSGPTFADLLAIVGLPGETINAAALDGYSLDIPRERLVGDGAILATSMNGAPLPDDRQPFWIIFPETGTEAVDLERWDWSVYQLVSLTMR